MNKHSSLKRRKSNPNPARTRDYFYEPISDKGESRYVPDPTFHSRRALKVSRTKSNPERRVNTSTDGYMKDREIPERYRDINQGKVVIQEQPSLNYFGYLGHEFSPRRLTGESVIFQEKPVIITSTSVVLPDATSDVSNSDANEVFDLRSNREYVGNHCTNNNSIKSGFENTIDCCSCMCCAKAILYHCTKDSDSEGTMADHVCTCWGPRDDCLKRWGTLGILTIFMPCLLCYLPLDGCNRCYLYIKRHFT